MKLSAAGELALLRELERRGLIRAVITQNIDRLHRLAGSERLIEGLLVLARSERGLAADEREAVRLDHVVREEAARRPAVRGASGGPEGRVARSVLRNPPRWVASRLASSSTSGVER